MCPINMLNYTDEISCAARTIHEMRSGDHEMERFSNCQSIYTDKSDTSNGCAKSWHALVVRLASQLGIARIGKQSECI